MHSPHPVTFSEVDVIAIVQACCCLPDDPNLHLTNPVIYLTQQLRVLRRIKFDAPGHSEIRRLMVLLEEQVCEALAFELYEMGALDEKGLNIDAIVCHLNLKDKALLRESDRVS